MQESQPAAFDAYDQTYGETVNRALAFSGLKVDFFTRVKVDYFLDVIEALTPPASRAAVIDVGCGIAASHPLLAPRVGRLAGVDVSQACITRAAADNPQNDYRPFDGTHLPFEDASFDAASAVCVFHHVPNTERLALARDVQRVLRPGGLFAVFEHNPVNPLTMRVVNNCEFDKDAILLRGREAKALLEQAGFRDLQTRFILTVPAQGRLLRALDRLFSRLPLGAQYYTVGRT